MGSSSANIENIFFFKVVDGKPDQKKPIWYIKSKGTAVSKLTYGELPQGFTDSIPPKALE